MRLWSILTAPRLILSDTDRTHQTWVGMAGLRHKSRHKKQGPATTPPLGNPSPALECERMAARLISDAK